MAARGWLICLSVLNFVVLHTVFVFNALTNFPSLGVFKNTVGHQSDKYYIEITPAGWTFSIWGFIYAWQALWVIYSLVLLCRGVQQDAASRWSDILPPGLLVLYMIANCCNIAWLFLFDRDIIEAALAALFIIPLTLCGCLWISYRSLDAAAPNLASQGRRIDVWLVRAFVHNGLGIYATWTAIATLLNLAIVIRYGSYPLVSDQAAGTVALGILTAEIIVFVFTDLFLLDRYTRYTVTPYMVVVVALVGSIAKNWDPGASNSVFTAVLLAIGFAALIVKAVISIYRHFTRSHYVGDCSAPCLQRYKGEQFA